MKVHDKRETTGEEQYPEWESFDALDNVLGPKHSTELPTEVESLQQIGPDDETQDMSGQTIVSAVHSPVPSSNTPVNIDTGETQLSGSELQPTSNGTQPSGSRSNSRKRKQGRSEAANKLLEK